MIACLHPVFEWRTYRSNRWLRDFAAAAVLSFSAFSGIIVGQISPSPDGEGSLPASIHGTVLNRVTDEPIGHALVYSPDKQYATLTDDRGYFEFKFPTEVATNEQTKGTIASGLVSNRLPWCQTTRKHT
ncbi:MAG TPA: hypothetical protein VKH45_04050 [Candidatus Acidoferrum sp.]|nr:hypothetical protein [Candidatus Acidoferrum sp.]